MATKVARPLRIAELERENEALREIAGQLQHALNFANTHYDLGVNGARIANAALDASAELLGEIP